MASASRTQRSTKLSYAPDYGTSRGSRTLAALLPRFGILWSPGPTSGAVNAFSYQMKYVIVGCGRVGSTLAKLLTAESHDVTVVDENPSAFRRLGSHFTGRVEVGTGIDNDVLTRAGVETADGFVAVTDGDNRNVMAALIAQRMFGVRKIVARIYDPPPRPALSRTRNRNVLPDDDRREDRARQIDAHAV